MREGESETGKERRDLKNRGNGNEREKGTMRQTKEVWKGKSGYRGEENRAGEGKGGREEGRKGGVEEKR
jgi:hypothetical protein